MAAMDNDKTTLTRTCPPPTPIGLIRAGDVVTYQAERMPTECRGVVETATATHVELTSGIELSGRDYVRVLGNVEGRSLRQLPPPRRRDQGTTRTTPGKPRSEEHWRTFVQLVMRNIGGGLSATAALAAANRAMGTHHCESSYRTHKARLGLVQPLDGAALRSRTMGLDIKRPGTDEARKRLVVFVNREIDERHAVVSDALECAARELGYTASPDLYYTWRAKFGLRPTTPSRVRNGRRGKTASRRDACATTKVDA